MDFLQFSLFFAAVAAGFLVVYSRMRRTEPWLAELARLRAIEERLAALEKCVREMPRDASSTSSAAVERGFSAVLDRLEAVLPAPGALPAPGREAAASLRDLVESRLYAMGYHQVRILSDLGDLDPLGEARVLVECARDDVVHKGTVVVRNGAVLEARLSSVLQAFP